MNSIFNLLNYFFTITGDWGIAIVVLTVMVRILLLPISVKKSLN